MALVAPEPTGSFEPVPEGTHFAVCDRIINLGIQKTEWSGEVKYQPKVYIRFQIPAIRVEVDDKDLPAVIGSTYTLSMHKKSKLRKHINSWRGTALTEEEAKTFDISKLLGKSCQLAVTHNVTPDRAYANIDSVIALPTGADPVTLEGSTVLFENPHTNADVFETLPDWMKDKIEYGFQDSATPPPEKKEEAKSALDDDIPF